jgi:hypothetical protein
MLLAARQPSALIGKVSPRSQHATWESITLAEVNLLDLQHTTAETNRCLPHNLQVGLLCYWLPGFLGQE